MFTNRFVKKTFISALLLSALMITLIFTAGVPSASAGTGDLMVTLTEPGCTFITGTVDSCVYQVYGSVDPASVYFCWYFNKGLDKSLSDDLQCITLKNEGKSEEVELDTGSSEDFVLSEEGIIEAGDFKYTKKGKKPNEIRRLELILKSKELEPFANYLIEMSPDFQANNGDRLGKTYSWKFTTSDTTVSGGGGNSGGGNNGGGDSDNKDEPFTVTLTRRSLDPGCTILQFDFSKGIDDNLSNNLDRIFLYAKGTSTPVRYSDYNYIKQGSQSDTSVPKLRRLELTFNNLQPGTTYVVEIGEDFEANNGNKLGRKYSWEFTTAGGSSSSGSLGGQNGISEGHYDVDLQGDCTILTIKKGAVSWKNIDLGKVLGSSAKHGKVIIPAEQVDKEEDDGEPVKVSFDTVEISIPVENISAHKNKNKDVLLEVKKLVEEVPAKHAPNETYFNAGGVFEIRLGLEGSDGEQQAVALAGPIDLKFALDTAALTPQQIEGLGLYLYDEASQTWQFAGGLLEDNTFIGSIDKTGKFAVLSYDKNFADLSGHWAAGDIGYMVRKRIARGVSSNEFAPDAAVTRAEFAVLLARVLGFAPSSKEHFKDVNESDWFAGMVNALAENGLVKGSGGGSFKPGEKITREQIAVLLVNACKLRGKPVDEKPGDGARFADYSAVSNWAFPSVEQAVRLGLIKGRTDGSFGPQDGATRAESFVMVKRLLEKIS